MPLGRVGLLKLGYGTGFVPSDGRIELKPDGKIEGAVPVGR